MALDPITLALVQNRLDDISQQMGWVMLRTARSPIFSHAHDFSCFITDAGGSIVSQADGIPIHTGGGGFAIRALLGAFGKDIAEDDVFILSDPYAAGGNHLPDWVIARPVYYAGRLVAFTCNRAHQSDIGGGAAGTYNPAASEIFHEGIRLPVMRLADGGKVREDLWQLLLLNTRTPHLLDGDLRAMMGSTRIGGEKIAELLGGLGVEQGLAYFSGILEHADRRFRQAVAALSDGVYTGEDWFDNDCFEPMDIGIRVTITVAGDSLTVDFTGTDPQMRGFKNSSLANTYSSVYTALSSFFDPAIQRNEGTFRGVRIVAPEGTVVNARAPAPLTMCTVFPACEIMHACWQALGKADPARSCAGWGDNSFPISSGLQANGERFVMYHWAGSSGGGAVDGRDGFPQQGGLNSLCGLVIPNIETFEQLFPVRALRQELRCDSAGAGKYRGGTGAHYEMEIKTPVEFSFRGEGFSKFPAFGARGGLPGAVGDMKVEPVDGEAFTPPPYGVRRAGPNRLRQISPGGGGWGNPFERLPELVLRDVRDGVVSRKAAEVVYGVILGADGRTVDEAATASLRNRA
ncbi:MAG: hydantoinase [Betaproteobacteria bacterium RIFCSPLOWO2_02_FULL_63_19]|nr:MAG: hydantoinase [Betaproteobacteria bacterium RIFCSPLOWO2_02_FULL_63_19]